MVYKLIGLIVLLGACCTAQKVDMQLYYESLCEDSQAFVTQQLYPALKNGLKDYVDIQWIPFGKSSFETRGSEVIFRCHHGPNECYGNKVHSCALKHIQSSSYQHEHTRESLILDYINCLMKAGKNFPDNIYPGERCSQEVHIPNHWRQIAECANSTEGSLALKEFGEITNNLKPKLESVPFITFRNQQNPEVQKLALTNFAKALCNEIEHPKPVVCAAHNAGVMTTIAITPMIAIFAFISTHILG